MKKITKKDEKLNQNKIKTQIHDQVVQSYVTELQKQLQGNEEDQSKSPNQLESKRISNILIDQQFKMPVKSINRLVQVDFPDEYKKEKDQLSHHNTQLQQLMKKLAYENESLRKGIKESPSQPRSSLKAYQDKLREEE